MPIFKTMVIGKAMKNNHLAVLQAKKTELLKAIKDKQKEIDCFDVLEYFDGEMLIDELREGCGTVNIMGYEFNAIDALYELDSIDFREMYNNHIGTLDKNDFKEYKELEEELEELENELMEIEEQIEQLENE